MSPTPAPPAPARRLGVLVLLLAGVLGLLLLVPAAAGAAPEDGTVTWGIRPTDNEVGKGRPRFSYTAQPGGELRDSVDVVNLSDRPLRLDLYASDAFTTEAGGLDLLRADQDSTDVGSWITLDRTNIAVPAGRTVSVPFTLAVPEDATPGDHTGGVVTSLITRAESGVGIDRRFGSRIYIRVAGDLAPSLAVRDVRLTHDGTPAPWAGGTATVRYTVTNTGNTRLEARQRVTVSGPGGLLGASTRPDDLAELLPGDSRTLTATVDGVWPTVRLRAEVRLDPRASGEDQVGPIPEAARATGSAGAWALPWGQLLVVVVVVLLVLAARELRRRRRAKVEAAIEAAVASALEDRAQPPG